MELGDIENEQKAQNQGQIEKEKGLFEKEALASQIVKLRFGTIDPTPSSNVLMSISQIARNLDCSAYFVQSIIFRNLTKQSVRPFIAKYDCPRLPEITVPILYQHCLEDMELMKYIPDASF